MFLSTPLLGLPPFFVLLLLLLRFSVPVNAAWLDWLNPTTEPPPPPPPPTNFTVTTTTPAPPPPDTTLRPSVTPVPVTPSPPPPPPLPVSPADDNTVARVSSGGGGGPAPAQPGVIAAVAVIIVLVIASVIGLIGWRRHQRYLAQVEHARHYPKPVVGTVITGTSQGRTGATSPKRLPVPKLSVSDLSSPHQPRGDRALASPPHKSKADGAETERKRSRGEVEPTSTRSRHRDGREPVEAEDGPRRQSSRKGDRSPHLRRGQLEASERPIDSTFRNTGGGRRYRGRSDGCRSPMRMDGRAQREREAAYRCTPDGYLDTQHDDRWYDEGGRATPTSSSGSAHQQEQQHHRRRGRRPRGEADAEHIAAGREQRPSYRARGGEWREDRQREEPRSRGEMY